MGEKWPVKLACDNMILLNAAKLRHWTDGFTSPPKQGMLWILSGEKSERFGRVRTCDLGYQKPAELLGLYFK
jgi:hypothetical protein